MPEIKYFLGHVLVALLSMSVSILSVSSSRSNSSSNSVAVAAAAARPYQRKMKAVNSLESSFLAALRSTKGGSTLKLKMVVASEVIEATTWWRECSAMMGGYLVSKMWRLTRKETSRCGYRSLGDFF